MQQGLTVWFTGLSGAGKTTISRLVCEELRNRRMSVEVLDGDLVRQNLSAGLGYSKADRDTNIRRIGFVCNLLSRNGVVAIAAVISPYREARNAVRASQECGRFIEVFVDCPLSVLAERDIKGLYRKALEGKIDNFTGISDPYEPPEHPEIVLHTDQEPAQTSAARVLEWLESRGFIPTVERGADAPVTRAEQ
jgi:adenylylsulfate kinase